MMIEIKQTETFRKWRERLKDERARVLIASRLDRLAFGHMGDVEPVGQGISELRIHYGWSRISDLLPEARDHDHCSFVRRRQELPSEGHQDSKAPC